MDAVLRNLGTIPCLRGDRCADPRCAFQHSWDRKPDGAGPSASIGHDGANDAAEDGADGPRKRRKVTAEPAQPNKQTVMTAKKPVSPPPLKRKAPPAASPTPAHTGSSSHQTTVSSSGKATTTTPIKATSVVTHSKVIASKPTPPPSKVALPPRKPETLNPRHLKAAAPATHDFRFKALKMLHDQLARLNSELKKDATQEAKSLVLSPQELIWMALDIEEKTATDKPSIYHNMIKNRIMNYKRMPTTKWHEELLAEKKKKEARDNGTDNPKPKSTLGTPKVVKTGLTPQQEVTFLSQLQTPITTLAQWGYVPTAPTEIDIAKARAGEEAARGWEVCDRCTTRFQVFPGRREEDGALTSGGQCVYHWGKAFFPDRAPGNVGRSEKRYRCCKEAVGDSIGCVKSETHVFKITNPARLGALVPFAQTPPNRLAPKDRAVCFDCEMGYTVRGLELLRVTATSWPGGEELLDVLVHPVGEVLDLNSRFSGIWPEDIANAEPWTASGGFDGGGKGVGFGEGGRPKKKKMQIVSGPTVARDLLFSLIAPETPLIGHGLENDLNAIRIIHPTIIDTVLLFPHNRGLPIRHGLKMLMEKHLNKAIQVEKDGVVVGHDSAEDARAAGELVRLKVAEQWAGMKAKGWKLVDGAFASPEWVARAGSAGAAAALVGGGLSEEFLEEGEAE
ncbi:hypothetical protein B0T22DRAFT_305636 [Podospora appendiculata]|uniref:Exonuclease domain-containing protein n=1 Tax=Podospora appendiculata TaxID=314037 RepID=A0AAE0WZI8_9PEZI|nr:hypothetical protein B0T22DRAFT_305636 [Podospora appendiculata]